MENQVRMPNYFNEVPITDISTELSELTVQAKEMRDKKLNVYLAGPWFDDKEKMMYDAVQSIEKSLRKHSFFNVFSVVGVHAKTSTVGCN